VITNLENIFFFYSVGIKLMFFKNILVYLLFTINNYLANAKKCFIV